MSTGVRITAQWRGAAPTSGLLVLVGVVLDLNKPKPKSELIIDDAAWLKGEQSRYP
jgi:hypothetical protein